MATEIERKFLVRQLPDLTGREGEPMLQGYLRADAGGSIRVRITPTGAHLTVKGPTRDRARAEFEYGIPAEDARVMLETLGVGSVVEKVRYAIGHEGYLWEIDVFSGANDGLVLAEVELERVDEDPPLPEWLGVEVSDDERYYNAKLALEPFTTW